MEQLWADGSYLLGEASLADFLRNCSMRKAKLGGRDAEIWGHNRDWIGFTGVLSEQSRDVYRLQDRFGDASASEWFLDFGGNLGVTALFVRLACLRCRILTMEPSPWNYVLLRLNLAHNVPHDTGTVALRAGLAAEPGQMQGSHFFHNAWASRNEGEFKPGAFIKDAVPAELTGRFIAPLVTPQVLMEWYGVGDARLVKLDCEGCEWHLGVRWLQSGLWRRFRSMVGELHALCVYGEERVAQCLPPGLSLADAADVWRLFCTTPDFEMDWGCTEPKFRQLSPQIADLIDNKVGTRADSSR